MDDQSMKFDIRNRALMKLSEGISQKSEAQMFGKDIITIRRYWAKYKRNESLRHKTGAGLPKKLNRISKIVIANSLEKRYQSTRTLAIKLTRMGNSVSKNTVHRYLKQDNLKNACSEINPNIFRNLVEGMPGRIEKCIRLKGGYKGK